MAFTEQLRFGSNWTYNGGSYTISTNFVLYWEETTSVADNTSTIKFYVTTSQSPTGSGYKRTLSSGNVTINGTRYNFTTGSVYNGVNVVGSSSSPFSITVPHDGDGTKSISISMAANVGGDSKTANTTKTLTAIPRASTVSIPGSVTISNTTGNIPVTIGRKNTSFYTRLYYSLSNGASGYSNLGTAASTSYTYSSLLSIIPQSSTVMTVTLVTYSDTGYASEVGRDSATCNITIDTSSIKPGISLSDISKNSGNLSILVAGYSKAETTYTVTQAAGSPGYSVTWSGSNCSIDTKSGAKGITATLSPSTTDYTITITATVTDNRGATASASKSATVKGYSRPNFTLSAFRCVSTSDGNADIAGTAVQYNRSAVSYTQLSGNSLSVAFNRGSTSISTASTAQSGRFALAQDASITVTCTATDTVSGAVTQSINISVASFPLDLYQNGNEVGVGLGATAKSGNVVSGLPFVSSAGSRVFNTSINQGTAGYIKFATITNTGNYTNKPIVFEVNRRDNYYNNRLYVRFVNGNTTDPTLDKFYTDYNTDYYIHKTAASTWDLYSYYTGYQRVDVLEYYKDSYNGVTVSWKNEFVASLPTGYVQATMITYNFNVVGAITAKNIDIDNADGVVNAGWRTDPNGNLVHKRTTASDTFNIMNNAGTSKFALKWEDGTIDSYGQFIYLKYGHNDNNSYLANNTNGVYLAARKSGEAVFLETTDQGVFHRFNGTNYEISSNLNMWKYEKLLKDFNSYDLATTSNVTIPGGYWYQALVFICRTGTDPSFRHTLIVPHSQIQASKPSWYYGVSGTSQYAGLYLWRSGNDVIMCGAGGGAGNVYQCYGIGGSF